MNKKLLAKCIFVIVSWIVIFTVCSQAKAVEYTRIVFDVILERPMDDDTVTRLKIIQSEIEALKAKFRDINEQEKTTTKVNICRHGTTAADNLPCDPYVDYKEIDLDKANEAELVVKAKPSPTPTPLKIK